MEDAEEGLGRVGNVGHHRLGVGIRRRRSRTVARHEQRSSRPIRREIRPRENHGGPLGHGAGGVW